MFYKNSFHKLSLSHTHRAWVERCALLCASAAEHCKVIQFVQMRSELETRRTENGSGQTGLKAELGSDEEEEKKRRKRPIKGGAGRGGATSHGPVVGRNLTPINIIIIIQHLAAAGSARSRGFTQTEPRLTSTSRKNKQLVDLLSAV